MSQNDVIIAEIMKDEAEIKLKNMGYEKKPFTKIANNLAKIKNFF